jgi:hypothetical protein
MKMITVEEDAWMAPDDLALGWAGAVNETDAATDAGLLVTLSSRLHCRTPMKLVDLEELSVRQPVQVDGRGVIRFEKRPAPEGMVTYRCTCGFTMDVPSLAMEYAVAS